MTVEIQGQFLNFLLMSDKGQKLFKYVYEYDQSELLEKIFSFKGVKILIDILVSFYKEYEELPNKDTYQHLKSVYAPYLNWKQQASEDELIQMGLLETKLFSPVDNEKYSLDQIKEFILANHALHFQKKELQLLSEGLKNPAQIFEQLTEERYEFIAQLNLDVHGEDITHADALNPEPNALDKIRGLSPYPTVYESLNLYKNALVLLLSDAKMGKTLVTLVLALHLALRGMHVLYADLENGLYQMLGRLFQSIIGCKKEWIYSGVYVHRDRINQEYRDEQGVLRPVLEYDWQCVYGVGTQVYKIMSWKEESEEARGFDDANVKWFTKVFIYRVEEGQELVKLPITLSQDIYSDIRIILEQELQKFNTQIPGHISMNYIKECTPQKIHDIAKAKIADKTPFYSDPNTRVLIVDWFTLLKPNNSKDSIWQGMRNTMMFFKDMRDRFNISMFGIEGVANPESLGVANINPYDVKPMNSRRTAFDAEAIVGLCATAEERAASVRRLETIYDRYSANTFTAIYMDFSTQTIKILTKEEYCVLCPETAAEKGIVFEEDTVSEEEMNPI